MHDDDDMLETVAKAAKRIREIQANPPKNPKPLTPERIQELIRMAIDARATKH